MKLKSIYDPKLIEAKWQRYWEENDTYKTPAKGEKVYVLGMFPYPSGDGLHVGHTRIYTGTDVLSRFMRMQGKRVLHPMGWDAFGLPTENAAIRAKTNPKILAKRNIDNFRRQMKMIGFGYDWSREFATTDPEYYRWTQWLFLQLYSLKNDRGERLIYRKKVPTNWCDFCKTILANEEVLPDGTHERCGKPVASRLSEQWLMRITDYADRLLEDLKDLDWPTGILEMQRDWIGRKEGINIDYKINNSDEMVTCFTTTPVNFGMTFIVISPEHELVDKILSRKLEVPLEKFKEIKDYVEKSRQKTEKQRKIQEKEKTGVFTGLYAINHVANWEVPIWISDFVLKEVGTGAVQGCPAHDYKDFLFAKKHGLPIIRVVVGPDGDTSAVDSIDKVIVSGMPGKMINSGFLDGMEFSDALQKTMDYIEEKMRGHRVISYHLRDWIFSRQHYWGEPIPLIYCEKCGDENGVVPVADNQLPVELPDVERYEPTTTGKSPLSNIKDWVETKCPNCGGPAKRETDTMPNWAGSSWYFLRFADPHNAKQPFSDSAIKTWMPVDWYLGGTEHAVLHLLYSRFWVKALQDKKLLPISEPFTRLRSVGLVLGEGNAKMSKSLGNVVNPDEIVAMFGAETLRIYEMFMGPWNQPIAWNTRSVIGAWRFLDRIHRLIFLTDNKVGLVTSDDLSPQLHLLTAKITADIPSIKFNTAIAALMKFVNAWGITGKTLSVADTGTFAKLLSPFAPHLAEEIWAHLGHETSVHLSSWPVFDDSMNVDQTISFPVQVNGKTRTVLSLDIDEAGDQQKVVDKALANPNVSRYLESKKTSQIIFLPRRTINFVIP